MVLVKRSHVAPLRNENPGFTLTSYLNEKKTNFNISLNNPARFHNNVVLPM
jgi:hypothetical protein